MAWSVSVNEYGLTEFIVIIQSSFQRRVNRNQNFRNQSCLSDWERRRTRRGSRKSKRIAYKASSAMHMIMSRIPLRCTSHVPLQTGAKTLRARSSRCPCPCTRCGSSRFPTYSSLRCRRWWRCPRFPLGLYTFQRPVDF